MGLLRQEETDHKTVQGAWGSILAGLLQDPVSQALCLANSRLPQVWRGPGRGQKLALKSKQKRAKLTSLFRNLPLLLKAATLNFLSLRPRCIPTGIIFCQEKPRNLLAQGCGHNKAG